MYWAPLILVLVFTAAHSHVHHEHHNHDHEHVPASGEQFDSPLDTLIYPHFKRFIESDLGKEMQKKRAVVPPSALPTRKPHKCNHDKLMESTGLKQEFQERNKKAKEEYFEFMKNKKITQAENEAEPTNKRVIGAVSNVRFYVDETYLTSDTNYTCYSVGQTVLYDNSGTLVQLTCTSDLVLNSTKLALLKNYIIPTLKSVIEQLIQVVPLSSPLKVTPTTASVPANRRCRPGILLTSNIYSATNPNSVVGVAGYDYYMYFSARPNTDSLVLADALPCSQIIASTGPTVYGRPIVGSINFNAGSIDFLSLDITSYFSYREFVRTGIHETMHAFGFTSSLYDSYVDSTGTLYASPTQAASLGGQSTYVMTTPKITAYVRDFFGCNTLAGAELEEFDDYGKTTPGPGSHFETRLFYNEVMAASGTRQSSVSKATLNFLEDTGWYKSNFSYAEPVRWGYKQGCPFATQKCSTWGSPYFCTNIAKIGKDRVCTADRYAYGYCNIDSNTIVSSSYYYPPYTNASVGGGLAFMNFCPIIVGYGNGYCVDDRQTDSYYSGVHSLKSFCFDVTEASNSVGGACYQISCTASGTYSVTVDTLVHDCGVGGGSFTTSVGVPRTTSYRTVTISCPPANLFCDQINLSITIPPLPSQSSGTGPTPGPTPSPSGKTSFSAQTTPSVLFIMMLFALISCFHRL